MMYARGLAVVAILVTLLAGCASGPAFRTVQSSIAPIPKAQGRVFFYRSGILGAAIQPDVAINGTVVGKAVPNGVFFVDRNAGNQEVLTGSEVEKRLTFALGAGETRYVNLAVGLGVLVYRIYPELVDEAEAMKIIPDLALIGAEAK